MLPAANHPGGQVLFTAPPSTELAARADTSVCYGARCVVVCVQNGTWNYCMEKFAEAMNLLSGEVSYETSGAGIFRQIFDQIEDRHRAIEVLKCLFQRRKEALLEYTLLEASMEHEIQRTHNLVEHVRAGHGELQSDLDVMKNKTAGARLAPWRSLSCVWPLIASKHCGPLEPLAP
jgi:hypothetical protein